MDRDDRVEDGSDEPISITPQLISAVIDLRTPPSADQLVQFFASVMQESDRAVPILCFAYIENELSDLLKANMRQDRTLNELFNLNGPLGSAGGQIMLAHALGWIDDDTESDLTILRKIRNQFAHAFVREKLDDPKVVSWLAEHRKLKQWAPTNLLTGDTKRGRYLFAAALTAWHVLGQLHALPVVSRFEGLVDPNMIMQQSAPFRPRNLQALDEAFAKLLFLVGYVEGDGDWLVREMRQAGYLRVDPGADSADFLRRVASGSLDFDGDDWFRTQANEADQDDYGVHEKGIGSRTAGVQRQSP